MKGRKKPKRKGPKNENTRSSMALLELFLVFKHSGKPRLTKSHYTVNSEYETGFGEISIPCNEKTFNVRKRKSILQEFLSKNHVNALLCSSLFEYLCK